MSPPATIWRHGRKTSSWSQWMDSRNRWIVRNARPCFSAITSRFLRWNSESNLRMCAASSRRPLAPWKQSANRARNWASTFPSDAISCSDLPWFHRETYSTRRSFLFGANVKRDSSQSIHELQQRGATKWRCPASHWQQLTGNACE